VVIDVCTKLFLLLGFPPPRCLSSLVGDWRMPDAIIFTS